MSDESANESLVIGGSFALPTPPREHEEGGVQLPRKTTAGDHDATGVDDDATSFAQQQSVNDDVAAPKTRTTAEVEAERDAAAVGTNATPLALLPQHDNPHAHLPPGLGGGDAHALERRLKAAVGLAVESLNASGMPSVQADGGEAWINALNKSQWLTHLSRLLRASLATASALHSGTTCVVHCSDGWDRTSQVTSLAQLLISRVLAVRLCLSIFAATRPFVVVSALTPQLIAHPSLSLSLSLSLSQMELNKGVNMVVHEDEIKRRPRRTWFQTEDEKNAVKLASLAAARGAGRKKPIDLDATPAADADADAAAAAAAGEEGTGEVASERNAMTFREVREKLKEQKKAAKPQAAAKPQVVLRRRTGEGRESHPVSVYFFLPQGRHSALPKRASSQFQ
jgi:hypothetical protein